MKTLPKYSKSRVFKYAWKLLRSSNNTWSECLIKAWNIEKNGVSDVNFDFIYKTYSKLVYSYILSKVRNEENAKDILSETFIKVHQNIEKYDVTKGKVNTWLYTIANHCIVDYMRYNKRNDELIKVDGYVNEDGDCTYQIEAEHDSQSDIENSELNARLMKSFRTLKPKYRRIAILYFMNQREYAEIAEICNVPLGTVKGMISRCRDMLKEQLADVYSAMY